MLYHEATYTYDMVKTATSRYHSTAQQAATIAKEAEVEQLIIGHFSSRYDDETPLLAQAQEIFPATILAKEGLTIKI